MCGIGTWRHVGVWYRNMEALGVWCVASEHGGIRCVVSEHGVHGNNGRDVGMWCWVL